MQAKDQGLQQLLLLKEDMLLLKKPLAGASNSLEYT
jgi:hypothetical protein